MPCHSEVRMSEHDPEQREILDRIAIREVEERYFHALDSLKIDLVDTVFADEIDPGDGSPPIPREVYKSYLAGVSQYRSTHHGFRNCHITVDGDTARADTFAVDTLLVDDAEHSPSNPDGSWPVHDTWTGPTLRFHGLRYVDDLVRTPEGWRVTTRRGPICLWRYHVTGVSVHPNIDALRTSDAPVDNMFTAFSELQTRP
jgi:hypothetical protein